jgi:predicted anti-sigma-YlaC factor YlaD
MPISAYNKLPGILTCRESARLLSDDLDRTLSRAERLALRIHLVLCRQCRRFGRNLALLRDLLDRVTEKCLSGEGSAPTLTSEERARIRKTVVCAKP